MLFLLALTGCVSGPINTLQPSNALEFSQSDFDGARELVLSPGWVYADQKNTFFRLGLLWRSTMPDGQLFAVARINGRIVNIQSGDGLQFNIDGKLFSLSSPDVLTTFEADYIGNTPLTSSVKKFRFTAELLRIILDAKKVKVKLNFDQAYYEGDFLIELPGAAIFGFREFESRLSSLSS